MTIGLLAINARVDARIRDVLPASVQMITGYSEEDLRESAPPMLARIVLHGVFPDDESGDRQGMTAAALLAQYSFFVEFDQERVTTAQEQEGYTLFDDAMMQIVGWSYRPGHVARLIQSPNPLAYDGRIGRVEFSFTVPIYLIGRL